MCLRLGKKLDREPQTRGRRGLTLPRSPVVKRQTPPVSRFFLLCLANYTGAQQRVLT
jgi:hypothetical protein